MPREQSKLNVAVVPKAAYDYLARQLREAELRCQQAEHPEGWVMVPREPTKEMLDALNSMAQCEGFIPEGYRAMLSAVPKR